MPRRHFNEPVHSPKLTPEILKPAVLFPIESLEQHLVSSVLSIDLVLNYVGSLLQIAANVTH
ncbi:MAG: hypothetical protein ACREC3_00460 [Methyloceanibacter sp.]